MTRHCEMGGQSKTIKSLDSGQGLGDPSPQGDPDNHQILLFKRWHVYKLFKPLSLFGHYETQGFCLLHTVDLLPFFVTVSIGLLPFLFFLFLVWTGCGATLWYWSELTVCVFMFCQPWEISIKSNSENMRILAGEKSKLSHWITNEVTGSNLKYQEVKKQNNIFWCLQSDQHLHQCTLCHF